VSFFRELERMAQGMGGTQDYPQQVAPGQNMPDHNCASCNTAMSYRGAHAIRTGGLSRGFGIATDLLFGAGDEELFNSATERQVVLHVFCCQSCGRLEFVNDPRRGF
jgi:hypothetical protein